LCHGAGTTALALSSLAVEFAKLTTNATFYGISDSFLSSAGAEFAFSSIEEVASSMADLVAAAVSADKSKPEVWLGGWSYGGVVAFACARELATRGVHVKQLIMVDAPLGQNGGAELDDETRRQLSASSSPELVGRIAQHFEACNHLLGKYQFTGSRLPTSVLDVRPQTSNIDYLSDTQRSLAADAWQRISIDDASHITLVQPPFVEQVARHCLSCTTISGN
jgi:thioesterase domain-containing protein